MKTNDYHLSIILAAVNAGFDYDPEDSLLDIFSQADDFILENEPYGTEFVHTDFDSHGNNQSYTFLDEESGYTQDVTGEIFDFSYRSDDSYFRRNPDGTLTSVEWYDVPLDGQERKDYAFVFARHSLSNGKVALLYDYLE